MLLNGLELDPDYPEVYYNKSLVKLALGEYEEGWRLFEWRRRCDSVT